MDSTSIPTDFADFLLQSKTLIAKKIHNIILYNNDLLNCVPSIGQWLSREIEDFTTTGKMLRGALAQLGAKLFNSSSIDTHEEAILLAAGLELLQAGLLVHDDIMDHDETRRGKPTYHIRLARRISEQNTILQKNMVLQAAEAQGICVGDLFFFLAWKALSALPVSVTSLIAHEHAIVTLAQMRDVEFGYDSRNPSLDAVLEMYRLKTARYTVALPLIAGALLSHARNSLSNGDQTEINELKRTLESFGEAMGVVFQLQDDKLGLFADEKALGKPVGSDIKEGKKTPYILALLPKLSSDERKYLLSFFGTPKIQAQDIDWLRSAINSYGVDAEVDELIRHFTARAYASLESIYGFNSINRETVQNLEHFISYSCVRKR